MINRPKSVFCVFLLCCAACQTGVGGRESATADAEQNLPPTNNLTEIKEGKARVVVRLETPVRAETKVVRSDFSNVMAETLEIFGDRNCTIMRGKAKLKNLGSRIIFSTNNLKDSSCIGATNESGERFYIRGRKNVVEIGGNIAQTVTFQGSQTAVVVGNNNFVVNSNGVIEGDVPGSEGDLQIHPIRQISKPEKLPPRPPSPPPPSPPPPPKASSEPK